ncbi:MAG TPA: hypothetical protein VJT73_20325, partial [Polyangiaceae bacterium]|nr:hypothetical protein [Polyangiaceae bacterium]
MVKQISKMPIALLGLGLLAGACSTAGSAPPVDSEFAGQLELQLAAAPSDASCLHVSVAGTRTVDTKIALTTGQSTVFPLSSLPIGAVTVNVKAFPIACPSVTATSVASWLSDPVTTTLLAGVIGKITVPMHRNGRAEVTVDFDEGKLFGPSCQKCLKEKCSTFVSGCAAMKGAATDGPAEGAQRAQLCQEALTCVVSSKCGAQDLASCYCGGVAGLDCLEGEGPKGPCASAFHRAFEASSPVDVPVRFNNTAFG